MAVAFVDDVTGTSSSSASSATTGTVTAVTDQLYLCFVGSRGNHVISSVTGLGLTWTEVDTQCGARDTITDSSCWKAQGTVTGDSTVTVNYSTAPISSAVVVMRYSGVDTTTPVDATISSNSFGDNGACTGGTDSSDWSTTLTTNNANSYIVAGSNWRNRTKSASVGTGFTDRGYIEGGTGGSQAGLLYMDRSTTTATGYTVAASATGNVDWCAIAVEVVEAATGVSITQTLGSVSSTGFTQTVTPGAVSITQTVAVASSTGFSQTVTPGGVPQTVNQTLASVASTGFAQTVVPGVATVTQVLAEAADAGFTQTVTPGAVSITQALAEAADTGFSQTVTPGTATVTQVLSEAPDTGFSQTVTAGAVTITQALAEADDTGFSQTVVPGAVTITQTLGSAASTGFSQTVDAGAVTLTVKQSGGDYDNLAEALDNASSGATISIEGTWTVDDTAEATLSVANVTITADSDSKHQGYWNPAGHSHYRLVVGTRGQDACLELLSGSAGAVVDGLAIKSTATTNGTECIKNNSGGTATFKNLVVWNSAGTSDNDGVHAGGVDGSVTNIINCAIYSAYRAGINIQAGAGETIVANVLSCTIWDCGQGTDTADGGIVARSLDTGSATYNIFNTISVGNGGDGDYSGTGDGTFAWNISNSMDSDNTIAGVLDTGANNYANYTARESTAGGNEILFRDLTEATADLRLVDDDTNNDGQTLHSVSSAHGMSIGGTPEAIHDATDILGNTRTSPYDIGAHSATDDTATATVNQTLAAVSSTGFSQSVVPGTVSITQLVAEAADTGFSQTVVPGAITITQTLAEAASTGFTQSVIMAGLGQMLGSVASTGFSQTVVPGTATVTQTLSTAASTGFSQTVEMLVAPVIDQTLASVASTGFTQSVTVGAVSVTQTIAEAADTGFSQTVTPGAATVSQSLGTAASTGFSSMVVGTGLASRERSGGIGIGYYARVVRPEPFELVVHVLGAVSATGFSHTITALAGGQTVSQELASVSSAGFTAGVIREGDIQQSLGSAGSVGFTASVSSPVVWQEEGDSAGVWTEQADSAVGWN